jgi:tape measure domain-containing protein
MASNLENVGYNLILDDSGFRVTAQSTAAQLKALEAQFAKTGEGVKAIEQRINSAGVTFHRWVTTIGSVKFALMDIDSVFLALPRSIMDTAGELEKLTTVLKGLSTAADEAGRNADAALGKQFILNLEQNAPFKLGALTDAFVKFKTVGIDPTKGSLEALVNQVAKYGGGSEQLKSAALAIQQMAGKGTVSLQELRLQLSQAVPNAAQAMATGMGMSMGELTKTISQGAVGSEMAIKKMLAVFANDSMGAAAEQMRTWQGEIEKLNVRWELFKNDVAEAGMFKAAKDELEDIMKLFGTPAAHQWATELSDTFTNLIGLFHDGRTTLQEYIPQLMTLGKVLLAVFATNMIGNFLTGMRNALTGINASYREYAANAIAADGAVAAKKLSVTEQILAADAERIASAARESEIRQETLAAEIAKNQQLIVANDARYAKIDAARHADYAKEIANDAAILAQKTALFRELEALEVQATNFVAAEQDKRLLMSQAHNAATAAEYAAQDVYVTKLEQRLASMRAEIALLAEERAALSANIATLQGLTAAELEAAAAMKTMNVAMGAQNEALVAKNAALATAIGAERQAVASMSAMTTGAAMMEAGIMKLKFAFNALGGWITVVSGLIIGGIALWQKYRETAEQAARAAVSAATLNKAMQQNKVTQGQIDDADSGIRNKKAEIGNIDTQISMRKRGMDEQGNFIGRQGDDDPEIKALKAKRQALATEVTNLEAVRGEAQKSLDKANAVMESHAFAQGLEEKTNEELRALGADRMKRLAEIQASYKDRINAATKGSDAEKALKQKQADELKALEVDITAKRVKVLTDRRDAINAEILKGFTGKDAQAKAFAAAQEQDRLNREIAQAQENISNFAAPNQIGEKKKKEGSAKPPTDLFAKKNADIKSQLAQAKAELEMIVSGVSGYDQIRAEAEAKIKALWENGELDTKGHGKGAKNTRPAWDSSKVQGLIDDETMLKITENAKQQMESLKGKLAPLAEQYKESIDKLMQGDVTTPDSDENNGRGAIKFLEKLGARSKDAAKEVAPILEYMKKIQLVSDQMDLVNFTREIVKKDQETQAGLIKNTQDRLRAQIALENDAWDKAAQARLAKVKADGGDASKEEAMIAAARVTRDAENMKKMQTPMQDLLDKWSDTTEQMRQKTTGWADSTIDAFVNLAKTGKLSFTDLFETIGTDMLRVSLQKSMGGGLQMLYDGIADGFANKIGGNGKGQGAEATTGAAGSGLASFFAHPIDSITSIFNKLTGSGDSLNTKLVDQAKQTVIGTSANTTTANSVVTLGNAAIYAAQALASIQGGGGSGGILGAIGSIAGAAASAYFGGYGTATEGALAQTQSFGSGLSGETNMSTLMGVQGGTNTLGNYAYGGGAMSSEYKFADGGIMTQMGPLALRKYANGGIANSPQVAIYGEGSMNEAFVPLPDGRSIPVTITGGQQQGAGNAGAGGPSVTVNVINQTNQQVTAQQGQPRFDGKQMILDIVLTAATTPGNFRDGMKGALK